MPLDQLHGVPAEELRDVALLLHRLVVAEPVARAVRRVGEVVDLAEERAVLVVEPALPRPVLPVGVAEVPLADDRGPVAGLLQRLRQEPLLGVESVAAVRRDDERLQAVAERVAARHEGGARRRADRLGVELLEPRPLPGERVDARRPDVGAVEADVLPAEVVREDVDDVRFRGGRAAAAAEVEAGGAATAGTAKSARASARGRGTALIWATPVRRAGSGLQEPAGPPFDVPEFRGR